MKFKIFILFFLVIFSKNIIADNLFSDEEDTKRKYKIRTLDKELRVPDDIPIFDAKGDKVFLDKYEGKTYLLVFWATWCAPCVEEMPSLDILKKDFRKLNFDIIPVSQDFQGVKTIEEFYKKYEIVNLSIFHDYRNQFFRELEIAGLPTSFIVDPDGFIRVIIEGNINWNNDEVRNLILEHIPGNPETPKNSYKSKSLNIEVKRKIENKELENNQKDTNEVKEDDKNTGDKKETK